ncbi:MAG: hypothetical protein ACOC22_01055 [bacterium]
MANSKISGEYKEYASVDTAPGADGYWTNIVNMRVKNLNFMFFSIRDGGAEAAASGKVTLQFRCDGDSDWTDYYNDGSDFNVGERKKIEGAGGAVKWRAGIKEGDFTSGTVNFGFDW